MIIKKLTLLSHELEKQKKFYVQNFGFKLLAESENSFEIQTGFSILRFKKSTEFKPYHIAFGIPYSLHTSASDWTEKRVNIQKDEGEKIVDFPAWNAKAIYFYDEDKNICEFIARKDLPLTSAVNFDVNQVYNIAEIGLVTNDIPSVFTKLQLSTKIQKYDGNMRNFLAVGDFKGLFICINKNDKKWFPTYDEAMISDFEIQVDIAGFPFLILYKNGELEIDNQV